MCNPRRVRVRASRELAKAWEQEISRVVTLREEVVGEARVRERLAGSIGAPALAALEMTLDRADGWELRGDDTYVHELAGGHIAYHLDSQELEIVAYARDVVQATGGATRVARGQVTELVEARGEGVYYDDEWGGRTRQDAQRIAQEDAQQQLQASEDRLLEQARQQAEREQGGTVEVDAAARAREELGRRSAERAAELAREATARLTEVGVQGRNLFHEVLAAAYRDAILAYARSRHAENLSCNERDGVLDIQFELQG